MVIDTRQEGGGARSRKTGVVVGYDGTPASERSLRWAREAAGRGGEVLRVVIVVDPQMPVTHEWQDEWATEREREVWATLATTPPGPDSGPVVVEHHRGSVVTSLVDASEGASMLVLGSEGHGMLARVIAGSVSQGSARRARRPVVVVRAAEQADAERIVVGFDDSPSSRRALEFACRAAAGTGADVVALRAHPIQQPPPVDTHGNLPGSLSSALQRAEESTRAAVDEAASRHPGTSIRCELVAEHPDEALVGASRKAAMVVIGARSQHPAVETFLGSISRHVLQHARCTVAVVH